VDGAACLAPRREVSSFNQLRKVASTHRYRCMGSLGSPSFPDCELTRVSFGCEAAWYWPMFVRLCGELEATGTFRPKKQVLMQQGFDSRLVSDPVYVEDTKEQPSHDGLGPRAPGQTILRGT
jgi:hypothetical protein